MAGRHRRAKRPSPVDSSSVGYGTQGVDSWSQPLQNAGNDDRTSYPNAWINDVQRPNETPSTHWGWDRERTERPLYLSVSGEQDATNAQPGGYRPVMQQAMPSHYAEKIIDSGLLPDTRTQHRVGTSNTVEAQRHWNGQNDTQDGESSFESTRNDTSRLEPWPHSQHAIGNPLQGHERDPNFSSSSGFTTGHRPMHDADRSHELLGMSPMLTTQDFGCLGNGGIEFPLNGIDGTQTGANPEPWSFYQPPDMSHLPQQDDRNQNSYLGSISDATLSSFRSDNLESGCQAPNGPQSYITSYDTLNDGMSENIPAQHPGPLYPRIPQEGVPNRGPRNPLFTSPIFVFRPATPPIAPSRGALYRSVSDTE
ncbi:hypothetical protein AA0115_g706 [Alternaria tenuissima]|uniref:Uncharacterized protein n=1 Tax=Alternaria tenuissima TaxID=119927 RepID=A0AB37X0V4_9PLEO|nr:hypothetical protein AA0115_g706 [Alternaria tenuissima]